MPRTVLAASAVTAAVFIAGAGAMVWGTATIKYNVYVYLAYFAALLLVFFGAVHWGLAMAARGPSVRWTPYAGSVVILVAAWFALVLINPSLKYFLLALGHFMVFMMDVSATRAGRAPDWYKTVRKPICIVTLSSLAVVIGVVS